MGNIIREREKAQKIEAILKKELEIVKPEKKELQVIDKIIKDFILFLNSSLRKTKIYAKAVLGGSFAKDTVIKKPRYDVDIFVCFDYTKYKDKEKGSLLSDILEKALKKVVKKFSSQLVKVHGSRDYFNVNLKISDIEILFEIIPVLVIKKASQARNITDVSLLHVAYIRKKIKKRKQLADGIKLAKSFCFAQNCYGAESYVKGFSGYALELLVSYYNGFLAFLKAASKWHVEKGKKIIIDPKKYYKGKNVLLELNEAKLLSPVVLVDPVQKERNVTAALSEKTFERFVKACRLFLVKPSINLFVRKKINIKNLKKKAKKMHADFFILQVKSNKYRDIAGAKLLKFFNLFLCQLEKNGSVYAKWQFDEHQTADFYIIFKQKKEKIMEGPLLSLIEHAKAFRKKHARCFVKSGKLYAREKTKSFFVLLKETKKLARGIKEIRLIKS